MEAIRILRNLTSRHLSPLALPLLDVDLLTLTFEPNSNLVRPEGIEPPTLWSEARCSNPLSYGRAAVILRVT